MAHETLTDRASYRLIITRRRATEVLVLTQLSRQSLPRFEVLTSRRPAEQLVAGVKKAYRLVTCSLLIHSSSSECDRTAPTRCAVMEAIGGSDETPSGTSWLSRADAESDATILVADRAAIRDSLEEIDGYVAKPEAGPFARPSWPAELCRWVKEQIEPLGLHLTGNFQQFNASPTFSLVRIETTGAAVWFKATGEPNRHELPVTVTLRQFFPSHVPRILATHPVWNGWLCEEFPGTTLDRFHDVRPWTETAHALAELQIASVGKTEEVLANGCKDLRIDPLLQQVDPFLARMSEFMATQAKQPPRILSDSELSVLGNCLKIALSELQRSRIPSTLGHLDFNPGNIVVSPERCCFLDWAEACVTHPFVTLEYLLEHARRILAPDSMAIQRIVRAYLQPWQSLFSAETLAHARAFSPVVAVYAFAVAGNRWRSSDTAGNPKLAGYFRSLTRKAHREATRTAARSDLCLA